MDLLVLVSGVMEGDVMLGVARGRVLMMLMIGRATCPFLQILALIARHAVRMIGNHI